MPPEGGIRPTRVEYVQESTRGTTPSNPSWLKFSGNVRSWFDGAPDANKTEQRGAGNVDPNDYFTGAETHEFSFVYDLQNWISSDAANDGIQRDSDNRLKNTHSVVAREEHASGGAANGGRRLFTVGKGGRIAEVVLPFETEEGQPIQTELTYQFEKVRTYDVSQPSSSTTVTVGSSNSNDSGTVTIESEGGSTSEDVSITADGSSTSSCSFADLDAIELDSEQPGDIVVTNGSGSTLVTLNGQNSYDTGEGDLGIPALGTGSHSSISGSFEVFNDDTLDYSGTAIADVVHSAEARIQNDLQDPTRKETPKRVIDAANRTVEVDVTLSGPDETDQQTVDYLTDTENTIKWTGDGGNLQFDNAHIWDTANIGKETGEARLPLDVTFRSKGITVN